jgi:hypothetical protein
VGTFDQLSRAIMTMHDKANFTIAPIIYFYFFKIEKKIKLKKLRKKKKKKPHSIVPCAFLQVELLQVCTPSQCHPSSLKKCTTYHETPRNEGMNEKLCNSPKTLSPQKCIDNFFQCLAFLITQCMCHPQLKSLGKSSQRFFISI